MRPARRLYHDPRNLGLLLVVEKPLLIFRVAHGILHLLSAPTIKQLRNTVYCSRAAGILDRDFFWALQAKLKAQYRHAPNPCLGLFGGTYDNHRNRMSPEPACHKLARELPGRLGDPYQGNVT